MNQELAKIAADNYAERVCSGEFPIEYTRAQVVKHTSNDFLEGAKWQSTTALPLSSAPGREGDKPPRKKYLTYEIVAIDDDEDKPKLLTIKLGGQSIFDTYIKKEDYESVIAHLRRQLSLPTPASNQNEQEEQEKLWDEAMNSLDAELSLKQNIKYLASSFTLKRKT